MAKLLARRVSARALQAFSAAPVEALLREQRARLEGLAARLESVSYQAVLARGFALVRDIEGGGPVTSAAQAEPGARLCLTFSDGEVRVIADPPRRAGRPRPTETQTAETQGSLL
jgi:exodeoxyribonuclease VII large subunit